MTENRATSRKCKFHLIIGFESRRRHGVVSVSRMPWNPQLGVAIISRIARGTHMLTPSVKLPPPNHQGWKPQPRLAWRWRSWDIDNICMSFPNLWFWNILDCVILFSRKTYLAFAHYVQWIAIDQLTWTNTSWEFPYGCSSPLDQEDVTNPGHWLKLTNGRWGFE
jgi:hypothetical protein